MSTKPASSSAKKNHSNTSRTRAITKSSKTKPRFASAKKSTSLRSPKQPPTPVAAANVNKKFRQSLRPISKQAKKSAAKQSKSLIKPVNTRNRPTTATAKKTVPKSRSTVSKTLARSKTARNLREQTKQPSTPSNRNQKTTSAKKQASTSRFSLRSKVQTKPVDKSTLSPEKTAVKKIDKPGLPKSPKRATKNPSKARKVQSPRSTVKSPRNISKASQPSQAQTTSQQKAAGVKTPVTNKTSTGLKKVAQLNTNTTTSDESTSVKQTEQTTESKSNQFKQKLELFENELLKAKHDYEVHVKRVAFQKTVWQKKYFNLLRIKSNDPVLNELAKERKDQLQARKHAQKVTEAAKNGIKILSPINESDIKSETLKETANSVPIQTEDKQSQTAQELKEVSVNTETQAISIEMENDEAEINDIHNSNENLTNQLAVQRRNIVRNSATMIDKYICLRKDLTDMKSEIKEAWNKWEMSLKDILITELTGMNFNTNGIKTKEFKPQTISQSQFTQTKAIAQHLDIAPFTTIFTSQAVKPMLVNASTMAASECWQIGTQTELTEVDSQSARLQNLVNDLNHDLTMIKSPATVSIDKTPMNSSISINSDIELTSASLENSDSISITTQQWFHQLNNKMGEIHSFKNEINSIKKDVSSMVTQSEMDFNHLSTTLHAIGKYNQNMKFVVRELQQKNHSLQNSSQLPKTKKPLPAAVSVATNNIELINQQRREKDMQQMTNNVESTLQQIRNLYQATNSSDVQDSVDVFAVRNSPIVSNQTFFATDNDFKSDSDDGLECCDTLDYPPNLQVETELDGLSENLPVSREFLEFYVKKDKSDSIILQTLATGTTEWNSMVVNVSTSDDLKHGEPQSETETQSLDSNIDDFVATAIKNNYGSTRASFSIEQNTSPTIKSTNQQYRGKLKLLQGRMRAKPITDLTIDTDAIEMNGMTKRDLKARPGTPISIKSSSKSISDDMMSQIDHNEATMEEMFEESLMTDRTLLMKIDALDNILDAMLSG